MQKRVKLIVGIIIYADRFPTYIC